MNNYLTRFSIAVLITALVCLLLSSCADNTSPTIKRENEAPQRIYGKESTMYKGVEYHIIEVDGVEYINSYNGGIYPLQK